MADVSFDLTTAAGLTKPVFGKIVEARPPKNYKITNKVPFRATLGEQLQEVVWLTDEWGVTLDAGAGEVYALNDSVSAVSKKLNGSGAEVTLKTTVAMKLLAAAMGAGPKAFQSAVGALGTNMMRTMQKVIEIQTVWGSCTTGIGQISARTVDSGTSQTFSITAASWASGFWAGAENMYVDVYNDDSFVTKRNSSGTMKVTAVTPPSGATLGTVTFLGTEAEMDNIVADDVIVLRGGGTEGQVGLYTSASNSGTYLGISGATYSQWAGNTFSCGSADLTWDKVEQGIGLAVGKGLEGDATLYVSTRTWGNLNTDLSALRAIDASYSMKQTEVGTSSIRYHSQNGMVTVEPYTFMKWGSALLLPENQDGQTYIERIGSSDITFDIPDEGGKNMRIMDGNGVEFRAWTDQFCVNRAPSKCVVFTGIVNS